MSDMNEAISVQHEYNRNCTSGVSRVWPQGQNYPCPDINRSMASQLKCMMGGHTKQHVAIYPFA